jgi:hypothetical protein
MQFRGFRQFGVIGGLGMLLAWLATYVLMPPLLVWLDRGRFSAKPRLKSRSLMTFVARAVAGKPRIFAAAAMVLTLLAAWEVRGFGRGQLNTTSPGCAAGTPGHGEGHWGKKMTLSGRYLTPTAILTDSEAEAGGETRLRAAAVPAGRGSRRSTAGTTSSPPTRRKRPQRSASSAASSPRTSAKACAPRITRSCAS